MMVTNSGNSFARQNGTKYKLENKKWASFNRSKKSKSHLCNTAAATIVSK